MNNFQTSLKRWSRQTSSFAKLQQVYIFIAVAALLVAGVVGLMNYRLGQSLLFLSLFTLVVFIANGVVWALINTFLVNKTTKAVSAPKTKR